MRCLSSSLFRRFWGLLPQYVSVGPSQSPNLSPKQSSLRQSCSARPGLVTAPDVVSFWQKVFEKNGIPEARESSEYIVSFVLGAKTFQSLGSEKLCTPLTAVQQEQIQQLSCKRLERMPVQYVLGEWDFQDLNLKMRPPVFIPRPETESRVLAVDKEEAAVDLTRENVHRLQLQDRIHILHHNVSYGSAKHLLPWGPVDFIVSNPPYVFHEDMASLDAEILRYEDLDALDGGDDGMRVIKIILTLAPSLLKDSGGVKRAAVVGWPRQSHPGPVNFTRGQFLLYAEVMTAAWLMLQRQAHPPELLPLLTEQHVTQATQPLCVGAT
ncbi:MTRF1L release factor glutamine methyltransferase isoform X9 [Meleagris gallopavo]|uniref:MTRF1L release factor glutamine methyltransferase isoform X9 n=1 Tax=Meleagris gallopavo TaxID=9103 RepID=UPI00093AD050|nr:MTRF1L release factor glutamine methyltransferase isoform X9 [Meleagris gallopavo]